MQHANGDGANVHLRCMEAVAVCGRIAVVFERMPMVGSVFDCEVYALASLVQYEDEDLSVFAICTTQDIKDTWLAKFPELSKIWIIVTQDISVVRAAILAFSVAVSTRDSNDCAIRRIQASRSCRRLKRTRTVRRVLTILTHRMKRMPAKLTDICHDLCSHSEGD